MSQYLWRYYLEDDLDSFGQLLATATFSGGNTRTATTGNTASAIVGSPGRVLAASPTLRNKSKGGRSSGGIVLTRTDLNSKDSHGLTILHHLASSSATNATNFTLSLLKAPMLDLYMQDQENGWTPLHRALYFGNITIARALMARDIEDSVTTNASTHAGGLIKIKDKEANSPFDLYGMTIASRTLLHGLDHSTLSTFSASRYDAESSDGSADEDEFGRPNQTPLNPAIALDGDELYLFGSNKNFNLGFGSQDDRHFPDRPTIKRPEHLMKKLYRQHLSLLTETALARIRDRSMIPALNDMPASVQLKAIHVCDVRLAKFHTAVLTTDPEANLYTCGYGSVGRLGTGDVQTRFKFTPITGGGLGHKKINAVGLGQDHSLAVTADGEIYSWGLNAFGQLGYPLAKKSLREEDQVQLTPQQIFGPLRRENIIGCAASRTHSVVHTDDSLYTFGKNEGQLGLVDADARSLETQVVPRKVAASLFSRSIVMVSAIDKATLCLLENHEVWIFANYGYSKLQFDLDSFSFPLAKNAFFGSRRSVLSSHIVKICSGGSTVCALSSEGAVFTINLNAEQNPSTASMTNPAKIRGALSKPQELWSLRKSHMAAVDVDVGQDGSIIVCTAAGSVWKREKRAKIKDASTASGQAKDYKFSRVPGLTRAAAVRSNAFGAFAAITKDCGVLKTQIPVEASKLWIDVFGLLPFRALASNEDSDTVEPLPRLWKPKSSPYDPAAIRRAIIQSKNLEANIQKAINDLSSTSLSACDIKVGTTRSDVRIPCHSFLLAARSKPLQLGLQRFSQEYYFGIPDHLSIEYDKEGQAVLLFHGIEVLALLNLIFYVYTDAIIDVWHFVGQAPKLASTYRQVRVEVMKIAAQLELSSLERSARLMNEPPKQMHKDLDRVITKAEYFETGDIEMQLDGDNRKVHAALACQRCPFFEGLFNGRAAGGWLTSRRERLEEASEPLTIDLKHIDPSIFDIVLRFIYSDVGLDIFEDTRTSDLDTFLDRILDVLAVANELMLDQLAQVCQKLLGRYVNERNVCQLLNVVAPCSVTDFKDAALEYICLNLEGMLENRLLDELDEDLMKDLNEMVRENQLNTLPISKSGRAEEELFDSHPELPALLDRSRQIKIDSMALQSRLHEDEIRAGKMSRNTGKSPVLSAKSPALRPKKSSTDLMFEMEDDSGHLLDARKEHTSPALEAQNSKDQEHETRPPQTPCSREGGAMPDNCNRGKHAVVSSPPTGSLTPLSLSSPEVDSSSPQSPEASSSQIGRTELDATSPWTKASFNAQKLDMKQIMAQASEGRGSNITKAISGAKPIKSGKLSQRERMLQHKQQGGQTQQPIPSSPAPVTSPRNSRSKESPWQTTPIGPKVSLTEILNNPKDVPSSPLTSKSHESPVLTLPQNVPGNNSQRKASSESVSTPTQPPQAKRSVSQPTPSVTTPTASPRPPLRPSTSSVTPRSIKYTTTCAPGEPTIQLSMADILAQQQSEKEILKEAVARRSLIDIQEEQAFQEWWDEEVRATKERTEAEEAAKTRKERGSKGRGRGKAAGKGEASRGPTSVRKEGKRTSGEQPVEGKSAAAPTSPDKAPVSRSNDRGGSRSGPSRRGRRGDNSVAT